MKKVCEKTFFFFKDVSAEPQKSEFYEEIAIILAWLSPAHKTNF